MAKYLRQNTASQEIVIGRMVDSTDGNTEETALTIANTDIKIWKHGATTLADKNSGGATHIANGLYSAVLDATDTNTAGMLKAFSHPSGALAWEDSYTVLPEIVYDSMFPAAGAPIPLYGILDWGTAQASASGTLVHRSGLNLADDIPNGALEFIYSGTGAGQSRVVHDFVNSTDTASVSPNWTTTPSTDSLYATFGSPPASTSALPAVNSTQFAGQTIIAAAGVTLPSSVASQSDVTSIKTKTDQLTFTVANQVDSNAITIDEDEILDDPLTDSVPADGSLPTVRQALYMLTQFMFERSVSGTTLTVRKADGSTSLMTFTLNDATSPTSITRTT